MLSIQAGEAVRLRFRAATPAGQVIRPPALPGVTFSLAGGPARYLPAAPQWDGQQWTVLVDTSEWEPGTYTAFAEVSGPDGRGLAQAEFEVVTAV